jgi:hypothetical protein
LTIGILDEFFWFRLPIQFFPLFEYPIHQVAKDRVKKEKKKDKQNISTHGRYPLIKTANSDAG